MVRYTGVNHLAMVTGDMGRTIRFWRDLLGMRLVAGLGRPGSRHYFFEINGQDMIAFFEWDGALPLPEKDHGYPVRGPVGFDHVSFGVETGEDLRALKEKLSAAGQWVSEVIDHGFIHSIYAFDPNGIAIEFSWAVPERDVRKTPVLVDREPPREALEGPEPRPEAWPEPPGSAGPGEGIYPGAGVELFEKKNWFEK